MDTLFKCIIELPKHGIKKNNKQIFQNRATGKRFIASNSKAQYLENYLKMQLVKEKLKTRLDTIDCDVNVAMVFYYPMSVFFNKKGKRSNKVADLSNLYEMPQDCLQKAGIISNDSNICSHDGSRRLSITENKFILKIEITKAV